MFELQDYDFILDQSRIAQRPSDRPSDAQLLCRDGKDMYDRHIRDIPKLLDPGTMICFNDSKVVKARLTIDTATRVRPDGRSELLRNTEILFLDYNGWDNQFIAMIRPGKKFQPWDTIIADCWIFEVLLMHSDGRILRSNKPINEIMQQSGNMPLPPYITYDYALEDRYQSVLAKHAWSVAAPTASLHFDVEMIDQLQRDWHDIVTMTLHVGLGTFQTVKNKDIRTHDIHSEHLIIPLTLRDTIAVQKFSWSPILAIGTTVCRSLESLPYLRVYSADAPWKQQVKHVSRRDELTADISREQSQYYIVSSMQDHDRVIVDTKLFLYPGVPFYIIDQLITNFHLPKSSLLMLVAAFVGYNTMKQLYDHALAGSYRFFSFGDAMWLKNKNIV
jgi:S-adenosylmethionine:tRNA ribosyltransferase-isomerase